MSPRTFVSRTAALLALVALGAACETKTIVTPVNNQPVGVTVSPQSATLTTVGQTAQFVALVTGGDNTTARTVTWSSSNTAVATVDANGVAKAVAAGTASIIATSTADATAKGAALVTVTLGTPVDTTKPATVSIASITNAQGTQIANYSGITGTIIVNANVDAPKGTNATAVNFQLNGKTVCTQAISAGKSTGDVVAQAADAVTFSCPIKTDSTVAGVPVYANGPYTITVALAGTSASASQAVAFANTSNIAIGISSANQALDASGLQWNGGKLTITLTPAVFNTQTLSSITVTVNDTINNLISRKTVAVTGNGVATVSFPADSASGTASGDATEGLQNMETPGLVVTVSAAVTSAGQPFSGTLGAARLRYDDKAPTVSTTALQIPTTGWIGAGLNLASASTKFPFSGQTIVAKAATDAGVNTVTYTVQVSPNSSTKSYANATTSDALGESITNTAFVARIRVCDALNNCSSVYAPGTSGSPVQFGVDLTAPTFTASNAASLPGNNTAVAQGTNIDLTGAFQDNLSGFGPTPVFATVDTITAKGRGCFMGSNSASPVGSAPCSIPVQTQLNGITLAAANNAYYYVSMQAMDQAGNLSAPVTETYLVDNIAPTVGTIGLPPSFTGGANTTFSTTATDNLDLNTSELHEDFANGASLTFNKPTQLGTFGFDVLTTTAAVSETVPFVKSLYMGAVDASNTANAVQPTSLWFKVTDQAGNVTNSTKTPLINVPAVGAISGVNSSSTFALTSPSAAKSLCDTSTGSCGNVTATSVQLVAQVTGQSGTFVNPFTQVYFYYVGTDGYAHVIGTTGSPTVTDVGSGATGRTWTYTQTFNAAGFGGFAPVTIYALGVDAQGDAWLTAPNTNITVIAGS